MRSAPRVLVGAVLALAVGGCAAWPRHWSARPCCVDAKPMIRRQPIAWHALDVTVFSQVEQGFHLVRTGRKWLGSPVRSLNLRDGEVSDTAFFTPGDPAQLSPEEVRWGPSRPEDRPVPPVGITKLKAEGKTAGWFVTDSRGVRFLLKLDPVDAPELLSGAEAVASKLVHALGYHVPSYEVTFLRPEELRIGQGVMWRRGSSEPRAFTAADLQVLLDGRVRDGRLRVVASRILDGEILGPARFKQFGDCADVRALKVVYAWLNNIDAKDHNSLLVWDGTRTVGYLIDFGTSLGADAGLGGPKTACAGWTNAVDLKVLSLKLATLGWYRPGCYVGETAFSPGVGLFPPRVDPDRWKPYVPNLAFSQMNRDDARWMARRLARLSPAQIEAAVSAGQYSRPEDTAYLVETLQQRRDTIVRHYLKGDEGR